MRFTSFFLPLRRTYDDYVGRRNSWGCSSTVRTGSAANNLAIVRHIVMNLLRLNTSRKGSTKTKRMLAATSDAFRAELLGFMT